MPAYSGVSAGRLRTCHPDLQRLFNKVIETYDCSILCGVRTKEKQNKAYRDKKSQVQWPDSKHNVLEPDELSDAVDVGPYIPGVGIPWNDPGAFYIFAGRVLTIADQMGIKIRYGGDWDGDALTKDQKFNDLPHFERVK